tara:strand:+ start:411 stop:989 length:579 start_codon:yes stop_codon:yes gene_type:complete
MALTRLGLNQSINLASNVTGTLATGNGGTGATSFTAGITHASQWRMTSDLTGPVDPISANLEAIDTDGFGTIGSPMAVSSGIWTFPVTGVWLIRGHGDLYFNGESRHQHFAIHTTTDNSSYSLAASGYSHIKQAESNATQTHIDVDFLFDVTNTSLCKCKFAFENVTNSSVVLAGGSSASYTWFTFTRLGDT